MEINSLNELSKLAQLNQTNKASQTAASNDTFASLLRNAVDDVNTTQQAGYNAMQGIATGKVTNLQEAVQRIEEAELSLKLALEVKNKAVNGFKEVMRMSV